VPDRRQLRVFGVRPVEQGAGCCADGGDPMTAAPRDREAAAIAVLVDLHLEGPMEWMPHHYDTAEAAARLAAEWVRRDGRNQPATDAQGPQERRKRKPRDDTPPSSRQAVQARSGGVCEARTPWCQGEAREIHHRAGRGFAGCHHPDLLLHVCGHGNLDGCHGFIETHGTEAFDRGWRIRRGSVALRQILRDLGVDGS
jgi:hypothetical protein